MIALTEVAADRMRTFLNNRGKGMGVRVAVRTTGCSGLAYVIEFVDELQSDDVTFEDQGVTLVVDKKSLLYLDGSVLDYTKEGLNEGFKFNNPNEKETCGCGESFTV
ncbi:MAG TPA: iron-sulfur cluster assembly protein IscA [Gammaproteobacteria bacterium]|nr:iron-sulfur cluster assembly protein IscA [Gammaproteobacteria bacterium]